MGTTQSEKRNDAGASEHENPSTLSERPRPVRHDYSNSENNVSHEDLAETFFKNIIDNMTKCYQEDQIRTIENPELADGVQNNEPGPANLPAVHMNDHVPPPLPFRGGGQRARGHHGRLGRQVVGPALQLPEENEGAVDEPAIIARGIGRARRGRGGPRRGHGQPRRGRAQIALPVQHADVDLIVVVDDGEVIEDVVLEAMPLILADAGLAVEDAVPVPGAGNAEEGNIEQLADAVLAVEDAVPVPAAGLNFMEEDHWLLHDAETLSLLQQEALQACRINAEDMMASDSELSCVVCRLHKRNYTAEPCGHFCMCSACTIVHRRSVRRDALGAPIPIRCPVCRGTLNGYRRVFQ